MRRTGLFAFNLVFPSLSPIFDALQYIILYIHIGIRSCAQLYACALDSPFVRSPPYPNACQCTPTSPLVLPTHGPNSLDSSSLTLVSPATTPSCYGVSDLLPLFTFPF